MSLLRPFLLPLFAALPFTGMAQSTVASKEARILLLIDGSSSMLQPWNGKENRFETTAKLVDALMDSMYRINPNVEFALRMYGHQSPVPDSNCYDTKREVMFSKNNRDQMGLRLASLHPLGVSPIAYSLTQAAENDLTDEHRYSYSIILITDGGESCGGDLCEVAKTLEQKAIFFRPYIISMVDYAPLATQYQCLGNYLTVAQPQQIKPAIQTILNAYRPAFRKLAETPVTTPVVMAPPRPKPVVPPAPVVVEPKPAVVPPPKPEPLPAQLAASYKIRPLTLNFPCPAAAPQRPIPTAPRIRPEAEGAVHVPAPTPPVVAQAPPKPEPAVTIAAISPRGGYKSLPVTLAPPVAPARTMPAVTPPTREAEPVPIEPLTLILRRHRILEAAPVPRIFAGTRAIPAAPVIARIAEPKPEAPVVVNAPKPVVPPAPKPVVEKNNPSGPKTADFTTSTERATDGGLMVYFTDGRGKFYQSTPQIEIQEPGTGKLVKRFYRTLDPNGEPDAQVIAPGTYNVVVAGRANLIARNITIAKEEKRKLIITVTSGSLRFSYTGNAKRPVSEFQAAVVRRFADNNDLVRQSCTEEKPYEPGNYYLEINTLPITRRNLDIDFGSTTEISINEPGWVQFTNTTALGNKVALYAPLGDGYASFLQLNISGNLADQKVRLQPGTYEARWIPGPAGTTPTIVRFLVNSNQTTTTELK